MTFEVTKEVIQDLIATLGKEQAINEIKSAFGSVLEEAVKEIEDDRK